MNDFKVKCVYAKSGNTTLDKDYIIKNGIFTFDDGKFIGSYSTVTELNMDCASQFRFIESIVTEPKQFTKADLKTGDVVLQADGGVYKYIYVPGKECAFYNKNGGSNYLKEFNDNLQWIWSDDFSIIKVMRPKVTANLLTFDESKLDILWQRPEPMYYTIAEAEAALTETEGKPCIIRKE